MRHERTAAGPGGALKRLRKRHGFAADIGLLLAGAGGAQAVMLLTAPLLSRLYGPAEFAGLALLTSAAGIISRVSSFKYDTAIATSRNRPEMGALAAVGAAIVSGFTLAAIVVTLLLFPYLEERLGFASAVAFCVCLPVVVLFDGLIHIVITWSVRWKQFKTVSANDLTRNVTSVATQAAAGLAKVGGPGLMMGQAVGTTVALFALGWRGALGPMLRFGRRSSWRRRRAVAYRYRDFPYYQMPKAVMNSLSRYMPPVLISAFYGASATGLYYLAFRLTALPAQLVSLSLGRVLTQRFADMRAKRRPILPLLLRSTAGFALIAAPIVIVTTAAGPELFRFFLGARWERSGEFAAWTALWSATLICATPSQMAMIVQRKNRVLLTVEAVFITPRLAPYPFFAAGGDIDAAIAFSCIGAVLYNVTMISLGLFHGAREDRKLRDSRARGGAER